MAVSDVALRLLLAADGRYAAVELTPPPGWHVYWENPGDTGLATRVEPTGWSVGPVRMPGPELFHIPGGMVNYGWDEAVILPFAVVAQGQAALGAKVTWLACNADKCVPGSATLAGPPIRADLAPALARLPVLIDPARVRRAADGFDADISGAYVAFPTVDGLRIDGSTPTLRVRWTTPPPAGAAVVVASEGHFLEIPCGGP